MSIITEYRLKCDYCGAMSSVTHYTDINEHGTPGARQLVMPHGWVVEEHRETVQVFKPYDVIMRDNGKEHMEPYLTMPIGISYYHFCIPAHRAAWFSRHDQLTPPRPDPRPLHQGVKKP